MTLHQWLFMLAVLIGGALWLLFRRKAESRGLSYAEDPDFYHNNGLGPFEAKDSQGAGAGATK